MTNDEFLFWERALLALLSTESSTMDTSEMDADAALAVWREKRATVGSHVAAAVTIIEGKPGERIGPVYSSPCNCWRCLGMDADPYADDDAERQAT